MLSKDCDEVDKTILLNYNIYYQLPKGACAPAVGL